MYEQAAPVKTPQAGSGRERNVRPRAPYQDPTACRDVCTSRQSLSGLHKRGPAGNEMSGLGPTTKIPPPAEVTLASNNVFGNPQWNTCSMANGRWNGPSLDRTWNGARSMLGRANYPGDEFIVVGECPNSLRG
ncbi:hypothetical protein Bbelb_065910 [Branchiostoma belcheri]|nr:hypothetical protein Bbelb_065910 [Branchiostoma belcheri]